MNCARTRELMPLGKVEAPLAVRGSGGGVRLPWPQLGHKGNCNDAKPSRGLTRFGTLRYSASSITIAIFLNQGP
jgi:hypothetical protein